MEKKIRGKRGPYKKRKSDVLKIYENIKDICFPFEKGKDYSRIKMNEEKGEKYNEEKIDEEKIYNMNEELHKLNSMKFKIKRYYFDDNGKKKKKKKKRKYKSDDIRKKIKVKFHKTLRNIINNNLKKAGSKKFFSFLPQIFIANISKKFNSQFLEYTYKELFSTDFTKFKNNSDNNNMIINRLYRRNTETLNYLENNEEISKISGYYIIKNMKYKDILKAYFSSKQFDYSIIELKNKKEHIDYIQEYIRVSNNYINYYTSINEPENNFELDEDDIISDNNSIGFLFSTETGFFLEKDINFEKNLFEGLY